MGSPKVVRLPKPSATEFPMEEESLEIGKPMEAGWMETTRNLPAWKTNMSPKKGLFQ